jgi:cobalt-zinc-cadmium efflux system membrane fusion protein
VNAVVQVLKYTFLCFFALGCLTGIATFLGLLPNPWKTGAVALAGPDPAPRLLPRVELVSERPHTLRLPEEVRKCLGILKGSEDAVADAQLPTQARSVVLPGSTALDPTTLMRIRARFAPARVMQIAPVRDEQASLREGHSVMRELRPGDLVAKGDLLGVFHSVDVGNKKNDLIDALVQLRLDQQILERAEKAYRTGAVPEVFLLNSRRNVEGDHNAIARAENTLRTWDIPEEDLDAVRKEAEEISKRGGKRDKSKDTQWARVELRAPDDGTIVERNVTQHEMVVDNTVNLFQIAKVERLAVLANCPEDDLPTLHALTLAERVWRVRTVGTPAGREPEGPIEEIGYLIDPNQHTAVIKGYINNPKGLIRAGQFVAATIRIPPPTDVVEVPINALVDDGQQSLVFVQTNKDKHEYTLRRVQVTHRFDRMAFVRSTPIPTAEQRTAAEEEQGLLPREPLRPGERLLPTGVGELKAALLELESRPAREGKPEKK